MNKLIIGTIATAILMVALSPAVANQVVFAQGEQGQGHTRTQTQTCTQTQSGDSSTGGCEGQSHKSPNKDETTCNTVFAGKSTNVKSQTCTTQ
jgi:hypothetical protein